MALSTMASAGFQKGHFWQFWEALHNTQCRNYDFSLLVMWTFSCSQLPATSPKTGCNLPVFDGVSAQSPIAELWSEWRCRELEVSVSVCRIHTWTSQCQILETFNVGLISTTLFKLLFSFWADQHGWLFALKSDIWESKKIQEHTLFGQLPWQPETIFKHFLKYSCFPAKTPLV